MDPLKNLVLSIKGASVMIENEQKERKGLFLGVFLGTSSPSILRKMQVWELPQLMKEQLELGRICTLPKSLANLEIQ